MKFTTLKYKSLIPTDISFHIYYVVNVYKEAAKILEYKVGDIANIVIFLCLWKTR